MSTLMCPTKEQDIKFQGILSRYNPSNSNCFEMPICELFNYFTTGKPHSLDFNPAPDSNQLRLVATFNNWAVEMVFPEGDGYFKQKINFKRQKQSKI